MTEQALTYEEEKESGARLPNGAKPLVKLSPKHIEIVKAHLDGVPNKDIANIFRLTESTISRILGDPLVLEIKEQHSRNVEMEFDALYQNAVQAIRAGLDQSQPANVRLEAAKMFFKEAPSQKAAANSSETAEDVAKRLLQVNVQINTGDTHESRGSPQSNLPPSQGEADTG